MKAETRMFGEIAIEDEKIITFSNGIVGFPHMKKFTLIVEKNDEKDSQAIISWLQSLDEPEIAIPVIDPLVLIPTYTPLVQEEYFNVLGEWIPEDYLILVTVSATEKVEDLTVNLRAPLIINVKTRNAEQTIIDNEEYSVKHPIHNLLQQEKGVD